ncbi:MAG: hypothetical protein NT075_20870 [Chloroflexi bacterium]|nr:hypothetical protein [Chloroflexota bacterium]
MIPADLLASIHDLPINDKLSLIEAITQMLHQELAHDEEFPLIENRQQAMKALITELLNRPNPAPEKVLQRGMFKGRVPVDEALFKLVD